MPASTPTVSVLNGYDQLLALEDEWRDLFASTDRPQAFLRYSWLCASWEAVSRHFPDQLKVVVVRRDGRLSAACAFVLGYRRLRPVARLLGSTFPQLDEVLYRPSEFARTDTILMLRALGADSWLPRWLELRTLRDDSLLSEALASSGMPRQVRKTWQAVWLALDRHVSYEAYFDTLSHNLKVDHRRRMRRLGEMPGFAHVVETLHTGQHTLRWLFSAKRQWMERQNKLSSWLESEVADRLFERLAGWGRDEPEMRIASLRVGGRIIAASLSLLEGHRVKYAVMSHDPEFGQHSPGRTLTLLEIAAAFEHSAREFDLGYGDTHWKLRLANLQRKVTVERIRLK